MAFETGTASNLDDLFDKMVDFAVANAGFTEIPQLVYPSGQSDMYILHKGSMYWWFLGGNSTLSGYGTNGWIESRMMTVEPTLVNYSDISYGQYYTTKAQLWNRYDGPYTNYFFYTDGDSIEIVIEVTPLVFSHFSFGSVTKFGTWTGGEYITGSFVNSSAWNASGGYWYDTIGSYGCGPFEEYGASFGSTYGLGFVHYPQGGYGDFRDYAPTSRNLGNSQRARMGAPSYIQSVPSYLHNYNLMDVLLYCSPNTFNSRTALFPTYLHLYDQSSTRYNLLGHVSNAKVLNMELIDPKDTVELEWDVYPIFQKSGDSSVAVVSGDIALAYRRV
jgi:hypothetical protein